jgi:hypothetical protein
VGERESIVEHFPFVDAPQVSLGDPAFALADLDAAPGPVAFLEPPDDAMLGAIADRRIGLRLGTDRPRLWLDVPVGGSANTSIQP